ncbi:septum formation initiator family protein [Crassaminicella thermophila]|uniref:Septum formation initiator family protein n=1 Tax=Crassaminicella thermophila TaxID=2599308 RepID=A0A5C0SBM8_CRATE|nr:septum formation initiator family protein [Crassaminicella thermophila]QEK11086.1 septum formation initiator family protein [Crassaminicella thermophila]
MSKKKKASKKKNKIFYIIVLLIGLYVSWILINQQIELRELKRQEEALNIKISELKKEEAHLEEEKKLGNDPKFIEKVARERLKMVKPNEIIYIDINKPKYNQEKW